MSKRILKIAIGAAALGIAVKLGYDKYKEKKKEYRKEEEDTKDDIIRKYTAFFDRKLVEVEEGPFEGCELKAFSSKLILDMSRAKLEKDIYVSFDAKGSNLSIILPPGVNTNVDIARNLSRINNYSEKRAKNLHTVYIIGNAIGSSVEIVPENVYLDNDEEEENEDFADVINSSEDMA